MSSLGSGWVLGLEVGGYCKAGYLGSAGWRISEYQGTAS